MARERISLLARKDCYIADGADLIVYSDNLSTEKVHIYGATGLTTISTTSAATTGTIRSANITQVMTAAATGNYTETLRVTTESNVKVGNPATIYAAMDFKTSGYVNGALCNIASEVIMPGSSCTRGVYYAFWSGWWLPASFAANNNPMVVFGVDIYGDTKTEFDLAGYLFSLSGIEAGTGKFYDTDATAATGDSTLKILINGVPKYLLVADDPGNA